MGYDMSGIATQPPEVLADLAAVEEQWNQAIKDRNHWLDTCSVEERKSYWDAHDRGETVHRSDILWDQRTELEARTGVYFRLNVWGMGRFRAAMEHFGMVWEPREPYPPFPDSQLLSESAQEEIDNLYELPRSLTIWHPDELTLSQEAREFWEAEARARAWTPDPRPGIAVHKFGSNDDWIVTPDEIGSALLNYYEGSPGMTEEVAREYLTAGQWPDYWNHWLSFLEANAKTEGFVVN